MAQAMTLISAQVLGSAMTNVIFNAIPQTYRDLYVVFAGTASATDNIDMYLNGDTTNGNYSRTNMRGDGAATASSNGTDAIISPATTGQMMATASVMDYSVTDKQKTILGRGSAASVLVSASVVRWNNTAAVTSVTFKCDGGSSFAIGSSFYLYGILA